MMTNVLSPGEITGIYEDKTREEALEAYRAAIEANMENEEKLNELAFLAADYAHSEALTLLFEAGVSPQIADKDDNNLLHHLGRQYRRKSPSRPNPAGVVAQTTALLLDNKVSALRKDGNRNWCPYHHAAQKGLREMVEIMAERGVKLNMTDKNGDTGIHIAASNAGEALKDIERKKVRMEQEPGKYERNNALEKQNYFAQYSERLKRICEETKRDYEEAIQHYEDYILTIKAFSSGGVDIDEKNTRGLSALDIAIKNDAKKIAAYLSGNLTDEGASDSDAIVGGGMTLHEAAEKGDAEAIKAIAKTGVDLNGLTDGLKQNVQYKQYRGCTALAIASAYFHAKAVEALLASGADPSFKDSNGRTAASYMLNDSQALYIPNEIKNVFAEKRIPGIIKNFKSAGMDINMTVNDDSDTLLILACKYFQGTSPSDVGWKVKGEILSELMKHNPDLNLSNQSGETALMHASTRHFELMEKYVMIFLEQGADTASADKKGDTALHYAARNKSKAGAKTLSDILLEFGADANAVNNAGKTALDIATSENNEPLVKLLLSKM